MYKYIINVEPSLRLPSEPTTRTSKIVNFSGQPSPYSENNKFHEMKSKTNKKNQHYILKLEL